MLQAPLVSLSIREEKVHKHKLFALVNVQMALGQTAGCPRVNRAKKFMCSPRNTGNISFSLWLTGGLSQGCPDFQKVYVFKVYVPFSCPSLALISVENCMIVKPLWPLYQSGLRHQQCPAYLALATGACSMPHEHNCDH